MTTSSLTPYDFVQKWTSSVRSERAAAQEHFIDLCHLLGQPTPNSDPTGERYAFEKGVGKTTGGEGFADVWLRDHFAWEYKGKRKNLHVAYQQLLQYREDLDNPPLLVVSDLERFEVHTNFTGTAKRVYSFSLADLPSPGPTPTSVLPPLEVLRALFLDPGKLKPDVTSSQVTEAAAAEFALLSDSLRQRGVAAERAAHFLMRLLFCLFSEDINLLPKGLFERLLATTATRPADFVTLLRQLFGLMATGGFFGLEEIRRFNGGLFADDDVLELKPDDLAILKRASRLDWGSIEPAIFGTLFERSLDPGKRAQLGAHYTSREDILLIVEPVLMAPLRRRWAAVQAEVEALVTKREVATGAARAKHQQAAEKLVVEFAGQIAGTRVLDPACGSGNFLYVALKRLMDLEKEVVTFAIRKGLRGFFPRVGPEQLHGIEINPYAHELAQVVVWIGYIQWLNDNGFGLPSDPILKPLHTILHMDAILERDEQGHPCEPEWPEADVIIGNPPFLGGNRIRQGLGDAYVDELFKLYEGRVPAFGDFVCYWFERTREQIAAGKAKRAGLLATQAIRGGANRRVLDRIKATGRIFWAQSDREWILDGAMVHVSMVGFDHGEQIGCELDGQCVSEIYSNLTSGLDLTVARRLAENISFCFMGPSAKAPFDIDAALANKMLSAPVNVNGKSNRDVVRPVYSGVDIVQGGRGMWTIDFGLMPMEEAAGYQEPFEYVKEIIYPVRVSSRRADYADRWWQYARPRPAMRIALEGKSRFIATPTLSRHRVFVWVSPEILCNQQTIVFAREDDYFFGVLHSKPHHLWALRTGTQLREFESGFRYTPTSTFETFPFPWPPGKEPVGDPRVEAIAAAARELVGKRDAWLNPPGASEAELKRRTLTNLYNQRPTWLEHAHRALDEAVLDAYGWPHDLSDEEVLERLLALNLVRDGA